MINFMWMKIFFKGRVFFLISEKNFFYFCKNIIFRGNFMGNRLRAFPNRENASLTLIQGKNWVY